jgi:hypothetical protein
MKYKQQSKPMIDNREKWRKDKKDYNLFKDCCYFFGRRSLSSLIIQKRFKQCYERIK